MKTAFANSHHHLNVESNESQMVVCRTKNLTYIEVKISAFIFISFVRSSPNISHQNKLVSMVYREGQPKTE